MSKQDNIAAQEHLADNLNSGDIPAAVESFAEDCVDHDPMPGQEAGRQGFESFMTALKNGFPDAKLAPETHRRIEVRGVQVARFEDGKIVERWAPATSSASCGSSAPRPTHPEHPERKEQHVRNHPRAGT